MVDDADLVGGMSPARASAYAAAGLLVVLSLPRDHVVMGDHDEAPLDPAWVRVADIVLEVRHRDLPTGSGDASAWGGGPPAVEVPLGSLQNLRRDLPSSLVPLR